MAVINNSINNTLQIPFHIGAVSVTTTGTQLNYLNTSTGVTGSGSLVLDTSPSFSTPIVTSGINDTNGNAIINFRHVNSAVNYAYVTNASAGNLIAIGAAGSDTDVSIAIAGQGTGSIHLVTQAPSNPISILSGTLSQHITNFSFSNTSQTRSVIFPDANGTLCMDTSSSGSITTTPPASASASLIVGTAYQNTLGYDVVVTVYISVTAATAGSLLLGVGPSITPTQQTIVSALTVAAVTIIPVTIYLPSNYYALLSTGGTVTASISGQQAMPV